MLSVMESANVPEPWNDIAALSNHELIVVNSFKTF